MSTALDLFGTDEPVTPAQVLDFGPVKFSFESSALRHIHVHGLEAIRNIAFVVRDRDWGTIAPIISNETVDQNDTEMRLSYHAQYQSQGAILDVDIVVLTTAEHLTMSATGITTGAFETNRAGFTVLHPIDGVAGQPVGVGHSDGSFEKARFPDLIEPWQPFMDITSLAHHVGAHRVTCQLDGDVFEMEDQRQWGDASYKTYNRPLALPWPYKIEDKELLEQSVTLTWEETVQPQQAQADQISQTNATFPEMALVITPEDALRLAQSPSDLDHVAPQRLLCHLDCTLGDTAAQFDALARAQQACPDVMFDLELICVCAADPAPELHTLAAQMAESGFAPASVLICPSVDRGSTPPGSEWPPCPPLDLIHICAAKSFPDVLRGGGMVSFFPELNRKRPPVAQLGFVSHGLCPIVHAADDISVMETLKAVPHITRSARAFIGDIPYRIGPASIAMRQNPYGDRTIPNPTQSRVAMADDDPRHRAHFGAAYAVGLATALAPAGIAVWTPAALYGPRGVISQGASWPIADALRALSTLAGQPVQTATQTGKTARLSVGETTFEVNLTASPVDDLNAYEWRQTANTE